MAVLLALLSPSAVACPITDAAASAQDDAAKVDFVKDVLPIFRERCFECHSGDSDEGDLLLDDKTNVFDDERSDAAIKPGSPKESSIYRRIVLPADDSDIMPAEGDPLTKAQIATIERWIREGASWPDGAVQPVVAKKPPEILRVPELDDAQTALVDAAVKRVRTAGGTATKVAATSNAWYVNIGLLGKKLDDARLGELLAGLEPALVWLNLGRTAVSDEGASVLAGFGELRRLQLQGTAITDRALDSVGKLAKLEYLNLYGTSITDAGLERLAGLTALTRLFVWQTKVTEAGARKLAEAIPALEIDLGASAQDLAAVAKRIEEASRPVNDLCPITGKKVDPKKTFAFEGKTIALCCSDCLQKFAKDPKKWFPKVVFRDPKSAATTVDADATPVLLNAKCPVSGEAANAEHSIRIGDAAIGFCCGKCKAKFEAELAKHPEAKARFVGK
ncbi:MAG: hypothetical protein KDC95_22645 [Planctomycetes bacterium]|nr:hypothetical protein [Planctomycetota bacterium]